MRNESMLVRDYPNEMCICMYRIGWIDFTPNDYYANDLCLTLSKTSPSRSRSLLKTPLEKEKLLIKSNFSFFQSIFYQLEELSAIFVKFEIVVCKIFEFGRV